MSKAFLITVLAALSLAPTVQAQPTRHPNNNWIVVCSDGHPVRITPFNQHLSDEEQCGEAQPEKPQAPLRPDGFVDVYGDYPTAQNSPLRGLELRAIQSKWAQDLEQFIEVVPSPAEATEAVKLAEKYLLGTPMFFSKAKAVWKEIDGRMVPVEGVMVAFPNSPLSTVRVIGILPLESFVEHTGLQIARRQIAILRSGTSIPVGSLHPFVPQGSR